MEIYFVKQRNEEEKVDKGSVEHPQVTSSNAMIYTAAKRAETKANENEMETKPKPSSSNVLKRFVNVKSDAR